MRGVHRLEIYLGTFDDAMVLLATMPVKKDRNALFYAIIKDLLLLGAHWKHAVEGEAIFLWTRSRPQFGGGEVVVKGNDDLASLALFQRVCRAKPTAKTRYKAPLYDE